eukprot:7720822-Lingulodinium_polyedra.AAC.1
MQWSLRQAALGCWPTKRHDALPWRATDTKRRKKTGNVLGCTGILCQITGDWKMFKDIFRFPQHNEVAGCCW